MDLHRQPVRLYKQFIVFVTCAIVQFYSNSDLERVSLSKLSKLGGEPISSY